MCGLDPNVYGGTFWNNETLSEFAIGKCSLHHGCYLVAIEFSEEYLQNRYSRNILILNGAPGETRTPTSLRTTDFESAASTSSATGALRDVNPRKGNLWDIVGGAAVVNVRGQIQGAIQRRPIQGAGWRRGMAVAR